MNNLSVLDWVAIILLIIGGINWGLIGFFQFNLLGTIFSHAPIVARVIYALSGLAAIWVIIKLSRTKQIEE